MTEQIKMKEEEINTNDGTVTQIETVEQSTPNFKILVDSALIGILNFINKPWHKVLPVLTLSNKFTVIILLAFFSSGYLPAIKIFGNSQTLYELSDVSTFQMMILTVAALYALGVKRMFSKIALIALVLLVFFQLNEMREMASQFIGQNASYFNKNTIKMVADSTRYGLFIWVGSFLVLVLLSILPLYQSNKKLWPALIDIFKTKSTGTLNVAGFTDKINDNMKLAIKKGHDSIEQINNDTHKEKLTKLQSLTTQKKLIIAVSAIFVVIILPMLFSGNSAPSTSDVEKIIAEVIQDESGFMNTEMTGLDVKDCEEISGREFPTFTCTIEGVITADFGALGSLLGGDSKKSEAFSTEYTFVHGESGWHSE